MIQLDYSRDMFDYLSYRDLLTAEFNRRQVRNPRYSLRSFAKDLELSPGRLSEILSQKQGLSEEVASNVAKKLKLNAMETDYFINLVESEHARSKSKREIAKIRLKKFGHNPESQLKMEYFKIISDWYHFAIMELTNLHGFKNEPAWIANQLGITEKEAQEGVERMIQVGLLELKKKKLVGTKKTLVKTPSDVPSEHIKRHHFQVLKKALEALYNHDVDQRDFYTMTLAIDKESLPELKQVLKENHERLYRKAHSSKKKNKVYCYSVQLFSLEAKA